VRGYLALSRNRFTKCSEVEFATLLIFTPFTP